MIEELAQGLILNDGTVYRPIRAVVASKVPCEIAQQLNALRESRSTLSCPASGTMSPAYIRWVEMQLTEGKNQEVRNIWKHFGFPVCRLVRVAYGPFQLGNLREGKVEEAMAADVQAILVRKP